MLRLVTSIVLLFAACATQAQTRFWEREWPNTDFSISSIDFVEIRDGGPPKDGIPAIDDAEFLPAGNADIPMREPVITLELGNATPRAYPVRYLMWHEIVNDVIGGTAVSVTFCPLCNSALVFRAEVMGQPTTFGVSGKLRHSDMIMYDRLTESWWQQFTGEGIVGIATGEKLEILPSWMESMAEFASRNPDGLVMAEPSAYRRYGVNPYVGYDSGRPFLYSGEMPPYGISPNSRVVRIGNRAWPLERLRGGELIEAGYRIVWQAGMASALDDASIEFSRDIGSIRVFDAVTGESVVHEVVFAFAFQAFEPEGIWMVGE